MKLILSTFLYLMSFNIWADAKMASCHERSAFGRNGQELTLSKLDVLENTEWTLGKGEPPISIGYATQKVLSHLAKTDYSEHIDFAFVHLKSERCIIDGRMNTIWFYVFALDSPGNLIGVSMTGRLIEPTGKQK